jgi:hypothetical protein
MPVTLEDLCPYLAPCVAVVRVLPLHCRLLRRRSFYARAPALALPVALRRRLAPYPCCKVGATGSAQITRSVR